MKEYGQRYCPIARASELFAERWTPIIVRNMLLGCRTFGEIHEGAPGIPRSLLSQRLRDLERFGLVETEPNPRGRGSLYTLTPAGHELQAVCDALGAWGARWLDAAPDQLDPGIVLWAIAKSMDRERLPDDRLVVRFDLGARTRFWLLVQQPVPELCRKNPGLDEHVVVTTDAETLSRWHMGWTSLREAKSSGAWRADGLPRHVRAFESLDGRTPFAGVAPAGATRAARTPTRRTPR